jgi:transcriptional regulator with XRE-family HTH domain
MLTDLLERARGRRLPPPATRRLLRLQAGLYQRELASVLGVSRLTLMRWESGAEPRGERRQRYAEALAQLAAAEREQSA